LPPQIVSQPAKHHDPVGGVAGALLDLGAIRCVWGHVFFFEIMAPACGEQPPGGGGGLIRSNLKRKVNKEQKFKEKRRSKQPRPKGLGFPLQQDEPDARI